MSLTIVPFEQSFGTLAAGIIDTVGAKGDAATILKRANTTAAIAAALSDLATGNLTAATGAILAAIQSNPNLDPAVALALVNVLQIVALQWQALQAVSSLVPFLSTSVEALIGNFATGLAAGAAAEIAKYGAVPAAAIPAAAK